MNIIRGKYKGRFIKSPDSARPTLARVKTSLFSMIDEFITEESIVLDLFAGSGGLGLECLSRGAKYTVFIDSDKQAYKLVLQNLKDVDNNLFAAFNADYLTALRTLSKQNRAFDIIFIDPPYDSKLGESAIDIILRCNLLSDNGIIVYETSKEKRLQDFPTECIIKKQKNYGLTNIYILSRKN